MRPLPITNPSHTGMELEQSARVCKSSPQARRLRAIAMVMRGAERSEAARAQGVDTQTLRDWIVLYNDGGVEGLRPARRGGRRCRLRRRSGGGSRAGSTPVRKPGRMRRRGFVCAISRNGWQRFFCYGIRWKGSGSCCAGWGSGMSRHGRCIPRPTSRHRRISAGASASWRPLRRMEPGRSRSGSRTRREQAGEECSRGSGPARAPGHGSRANAASDTAICSPLHARNTSAPLGMSAAGQIPSK